MGLNRRKASIPSTGGPSTLFIATRIALSGHYYYTRFRMRHLRHRDVKAAVWTHTVSVRAGAWTQEPCSHPHPGPRGLPRAQLGNRLRFLRKPSPVGESRWHRRCCHTSPNSIAEKRLDLKSKEYVTKNRIFAFPTAREQSHLHWTHTSFSGKWKYTLFTRLGVF